MPDTLHAATAALDTLPTELVQDVVTDCSLVAGLVSAAHHHASFGSRVRARLLPNTIWALAQDRGRRYTCERLKAVRATRWE